MGATRKMVVNPGFCLARRGQQTSLHTMIWGLSSKFVFYWGFRTRGVPRSRLLWGDRLHSLSSFSIGLLIRGLTAPTFTAKHAILFWYLVVVLRGFYRRKSLLSSLSSLSVIRMNLHTNPTHSQWNAHWEALVEAVVSAMVAPKASKKSKCGGGNCGKTASQKTCPPPSPSP